MRLLERGRELSGVVATIERAVSGEGAAIAIVGTAGIGKTRLLRAAAEVARSRDLVVLSAAGRQLEQEFPFGVVLQLFEEHFHDVGNAQQEELLRGAAHLSHPLFQGATGIATPPIRTRFPLLHGLCWLTQNIAERTPLVLLVDDVQWADPPSLEFLSYLIPRLEGLSCAPIIALRSGEPTPSQHLVTRIIEQLYPCILEPQPLSMDAVNELVRHQLPDAVGGFQRACAAATAGNPLLLRELLATINSMELPTDDEGARRVRELASPWVARWTRARLANLPAQSMALANAAAVLGEDVPLRWAARLAGLPVEDAKRGFDALAAIEILEDREPLDFIHPLIRFSLYADVPPGERADAHRRAANILADDGASLNRVVAQLLATSPASDQWVVETLCAAARKALLDGGPEAAIQYLRRAHDEPPQPADRPAVLVELGGAEVLAGDAAAAMHLGEAAGLTPEGTARARVLLELGRALYVTGRLSEARATFDRGLLLAGEDRELATQLQAAWMTVARLDPAMRSEAVKRMTRYLERPGEGCSHAERVLLAHAAEELVFAGERRDLAITLARRAFADGELITQETCDGMAWFPAIAALGWSDEFEVYEHGVEVALQDARRRGSLIGFAQASYARSFVTYYTGRLSDAIADAQQAITAIEPGQWHFLPMACVQLAWALIERGDLASADAALARVESDPHWTRTTMHAFVLEASARLQLLRGRPRDALESLLPIEALEAEAQIVNPSVLPFRSRTALALAALGDRSEARRLVQQELQIAQRFGSPRPVGVALRAAGLIETGTVGIELLTQAADVQAGGPAALEHARALVDLGSLMRRHGLRSAARAPLRTGMDLAHRFGAIPLERLAYQELVITGARPRRAALRGVEALTPSERRVAEMAREGATNRQIAEALFVTLRTIEAHLSRAYDKLDISSRAQLRDALRPSRT